MRGVSPVLGTVLALLVLIVLSSLLASFTLGFVKFSKIPQVYIDAKVSLSDENITLKHMGGDPIVKDDIKIEIATGSPRLFGYVNMSNVTFIPNPKVLRVGDKALIHFTRYGDCALFTGKEIWMSVCLNEKFEIAIIDKRSGQVIWKDELILEE